MCSRCQASCVAVTTAIAMMLQGKHMKSGKKFDIEKLTDNAFQYAVKCIPETCDDPKV